jgi:hypothetical protein
MKIGQCAISCGRTRQFIGGLQLLPGFEDDWKPTMTAVLQALGPGRYQYGSTWDVESRRDRELRELDGVTIEHVEAHVMQAVDFSRWANWDAYLHDVSNNARRNARRATQSLPDLTLTVDLGLRTAGKVPMLTQLRGLMFRRKSLEFNFGREWLRSMLRAILWRRHAIIAAARTHDETLAMVSCIEFGANTFYLEGASRPTNGGAAWHLMLSMLKRAFDRDPAGKFVMGVVVDDADLSRSREQCRVSAYPISTITFTYASPQGNSSSGKQKAKRRGRPEQPLLLAARNAAVSCHGHPLR